MWVHLCESNILDQPNKHRCRRGLCSVEQRPDTAVLCMQLMQGGSAGQFEERMEEGRSHSSVDTDCSYSSLLDWMLCFQECQDRRSLPQIQARLHITKHLYSISERGKKKKTNQYFTWMVGTTSISNEQIQTQRGRMSNGIEKDLFFLF